MSEKYIIISMGTHRPILKHDSFKMIEINFQDNHYGCDWGLKVRSRTQTQFDFCSNFEYESDAETCFNQMNRVERTVQRHMQLLSGFFFVRSLVSFCLFVNIFNIFGFCVKRVNRETRPRYRGKGTENERCNKTKSGHSIERRIIYSANSTNDENEL